MTADSTDPAPAKASRGESTPEPQWEREVLTRLAFSAVQEQRRARRWSIFFKFMVLGYFLLLLIPLYLKVADKLGSGKHTAQVAVSGVIAADQEASAKKIMEGLRDAFEDDNTKGIVLTINSPGGSPVQAGMVYDEIKRLRKKYPDTPLYAVVSDICASGGYYIASAADKIYVNRASLVGSIGVRLDSFGLVGAIHKLGIQRRLYTAGEHKGMLDPFLPEDRDEVQHIETVLQEVYTQFVDAVKEGRGDRLKDNPAIFSGYVWTGEQAIELGMADALGSADYVAREVIKAEDIVDFTPAEDYMKRLAKRLGAGFGNAVGTRLTQPAMR